MSVGKRPYSRLAPVDGKSIVTTSALCKYQHCNIWTNATTTASTLWCKKLYHFIFVITLSDLSI